MLKKHQATTTISLYQLKAEDGHGYLLNLGGGGGLKI
jgi:hypothetical protein